MKFCDMDVEDSSYNLDGLLIANDLQELCSFNFLFVQTPQDPYRGVYSEDVQPFMHAGRCVLVLCDQIRREGRVLSVFAVMYSERDDREVGKRVRY